MRATHFFVAYSKSEERKRQNYSLPRFCVIYVFITGVCKHGIKTPFLSAKVNMLPTYITKNVYNFMTPNQINMQTTLFYVFEDENFKPLLVRRLYRDRETLPSSEFYKIALDMFKTLNITSGLRRPNTRAIFQYGTPTRNESITVTLNISAHKRSYNAVSHKPCE